jgi:hypothetical protein
VALQAQPDHQVVLVHLVLAVLVLQQYQTLLTIEY